MCIAVTSDVKMDSDKISTCARGYAFTRILDGLEGLKFGRGGGGGGGGGGGERYDEEFVGAWMLGS